MVQKLLLIGGSGGTHVAGSLLRASQGASQGAFQGAFSNDLSTQFIDVQSAYQAPIWYQKISWHLLGKRPPNLQAFQQLVLKNCREFQPQSLITTGRSPLQLKTVQKINQLGTRSINFLTDDPWNPLHYAKWFLDVLPHYTTVFSPRQAVIDQLRQIGCQDVRYLPFGYDPELFFPISPTKEESIPYLSDVMFAGGGDKDRIPYISALVNAGINVGLYGDYWEQYSETRSHNRGVANIKTLRLAIYSAKIALCLVRRANRDGHVMRTFEVPAVGACMLTEDTPDHRAIFGEDGENVVYFKTIAEMVQKARWLLERPDQQQRLSLAANELILQGHHTYSDRLASMLK